MRIAIIAPGTGLPYYCENCMRDGSISRALSHRGHEVINASLYLPPPEGSGASKNRLPVFYGAINLYLRHRFPTLRRLPGWMKRALDSEALLKMAGVMQGASDAAGLETLTLSMLKGEEGGQAAELDRLVHWLGKARPDVAYLSNCLLLGTARRLRGELGIPVACSLQDEDTWINAMEPAVRSAVWAALRARAADIDLFLPVSDYYRHAMAGRLSIPADRMEVVPVGIDIRGFPDEPAALPFDPPSIGFLSRISERMGAGLLVDAFIKLCTQERFPGLRLRFAGGGTSRDAPFLRAVERKLSRLGFRDRLDHVHSLGRAQIAAFLGSLTVLTVPVRGGEAFGTFMLEAMAAGVPVVQPALGGFPEVIEATGGGVVYRPNTADALAASLSELLADREKARALGAAGFRAVRAHYTVDRIAGRLERAFFRIARRRARSTV